MTGEGIQNYVTSFTEDSLYLQFKPSFRRLYWILHSKKIKEIELKGRRHSRYHLKNDVFKINYSRNRFLPIFGQSKSDNINRMITITGSFQRTLFIKCNFLLTFEMWSHNPAFNVSIKKWNKLEANDKFHQICVIIKLCLWHNSWIFLSPVKHAGILQCLFLMSFSSFQLLTQTKSPKNYP